MKQKILFIDRDGTLIAEPPLDYQIDSLEKLEYLPAVFRNMYKISMLSDYLLVLVSNQDGLGTSSFPEEDFKAPHDKFIQAFENEGVVFDEVLIDPSMPEENSPNRKPGIGMLKHYMNGEYDLEGSFVIGDRLTDIQLAKNIGAKGILYGALAKEDGEKVSPAIKELEKSGLSDVCSLITDSWDSIADYVCSAVRSAEVIRKTSETDIEIALSLDGSGVSEISSGLNFFDHMLEQISKHGNVDLDLKVKGDLHVDEHHTIEDTGLALGEAFLNALGDKRGITRYAFVLPMDECLAQVAIDFGGRPWLVWDADFKREMIGDMPTEMFYHFFKSFSDAAKCNLNIKVEGDNEHHKIEAIFKAFARAIREAVKRGEWDEGLPSTKGTL